MEVGFDWLQAAEVVGGGGRRVEEAERGREGDGLQPAGEGVDDEERERLAGDGMKLRHSAEDDRGHVRGVGAQREAEGEGGIEGALQRASDAQQLHLIFAGSFVGGSK